ncbi:MAG: hypothetical protein L0287_08970 [Anaerolineae bacterium]|nr:hypothetical protein [Anaerolineae bacterium]
MKMILNDIDTSMLTKAQLARLKYDPVVKPVVNCCGEVMGVARTKRGAAFVLCMLIDSDLNDILDIPVELPDRFSV